LKRREYFSGQGFPPIVKEKVLEDKTIIPYWYKPPDKLIQHQLKAIVLADQLLGLKEWISPLVVIMEVGSFI
jgi:hypothetical protein